MALTPTILVNVLSGGGRTTRVGDFIVANLATMAFIVPAAAFQAAQNWARARPSSGSVRRDLTIFTNRFETLLAHRGCGVLTRGEAPQLQEIVDALTLSGMSMDGWAMPHEMSVSANDAAPGPLI